MLITQHRIAVVARVGADGCGLRRSFHCVWFDHLREQGRGHGHANSACASNVDILQLHGETVLTDNLLHLFGWHHH